MANYAILLSDPKGIRTPVPALRGPDQFCNFTSLRRASVQQVCNRARVRA